MKPDTPLELFDPRTGDFSLRVEPLPAGADWTSPQRSQSFRLNAERPLTGLALKFHVRLEPAADFQSLLDEMRTELLRGRLASVRSFWCVRPPQSRATGSPLGRPAA